MTGFRRTTGAYAAMLTLAVMASFSMTQTAEAVVYEGPVEMATGPVGTLLGCDPVTEVCTGLTADGNVDFDIGGAITRVNFQVGSFFFSTEWTGECLISPSATCMVTDTDYDGISAFVPIGDTANMAAGGLGGIVANSLVLDGDGIPTSGSLEFASFSPTFGIPLGNTTIDVDAGTFALIGALGSASGTGMFLRPPTPGIMSDMLAVDVGTVRPTATKTNSTSKLMSSSRFTAKCSG